MPNFLTKKKPDEMDKALKGTIDIARLPKHVAIVMDGNGRWAKMRNLPRAAGHRAGMEAIRPIIRMTSDLGIKVLTLFAFSTENWVRPKPEVKFLMSLLLEYFTREIDELHEKNVCIRIIGDISGLPELQREAVQNAMSQTSNNTGLILNIALNYGGRAEITRAAKSLCMQIESGKLSAEAVTDDLLAAELYTGVLGNLADVDLFIRTSGERRLSGFLLWQCAYAEILFAEPFWPDFDTQAYTDALIEFQTRNRRFGGL